MMTKNFNTRITSVLIHSHRKICLRSSIFSFHFMRKKGNVLKFKKKISSFDAIGTRASTRFLDTLPSIYISGVHISYFKFENGIVP